MIIVKELPLSKSNDHCVISAVLTDMQLNVFFITLGNCDIIKRKSKRQLSRSLGHFGEIYMYISSVHVNANTFS